MGRGWQRVWSGTLGVLGGWGGDAPGGGENGIIGRNAWTLGADKERTAKEGFVLTRAIFDAEAGRVQIDPIAQLRRDMEIRDGVSGSASKMSDRELILLLGNRNPETLRALGDLLTDLEKRQLGIDNSALEHRRFV